MDRNLTARKTDQSSVIKLAEKHWRLEIPSGEKGSYRLAQLDDYGTLPRRDFPWKAPFRMKLRARASTVSSPGTWGFGLWNNPFGMAILSGAEILRLPALPNTAWFFFASKENYLSLRNDLPANGALAGVFRSVRAPAPLLALGAPGLPLLLLPPAARLLRRLGRLLVKEMSVPLDLDPCEWHQYEIAWLETGTTFSVDGQAVLESGLSPLGPLGLVLWIDNQYAAVRPSGQVSFGTLPNPEATWVEIAGLEIEG
jgi:hypothetical protein